MYIKFTLVQTLSCASAKFKETQHQKQRLYAKNRTCRNFAAHAYHTFFVKSNSLYYFMRIENNRNVESSSRREVYQLFK